MKTLFKLIAVFSVVAMCSCCSKSSVIIDDGWDNFVLELETSRDRMNSNISALQAVVVALQNKEYVESIEPLPDDLGCTFSFSSGRLVTMYHYADFVTSVIGVKQDTDGVWYWTLNGDDWLYADGKKVKVVSKDGVTPKLKFETGDNMSWLWYMSLDDGVSWEQLGEEATSYGRYDWEISKTDVRFLMLDGTVITIDRWISLTISFDSKGGDVIAGGENRMIDYTLTGASENAVVETIVQDGWKAKVTQNSVETGTIEITAPDPLTESEIIVSVSDGGQTVLAAIICVKATIVISKEIYEVGASGGNIDVASQPNSDFKVSIPDDAKSWLKCVPTGSMATKTFSLSVAANDNAVRRNAVVSLTDESGKVIRVFVVLQAADMERVVSVQCDVKGGLHSILESYDKENIVKMKISGVLDDVDFLDIYYEMPALRYLDISDVNIEALPKDSFKKSTNVTTIILPKTLVTIPDDCFCESKISGELIIPASCETIGLSAFENCQALESVVLGSGSLLKTIAQSAFQDCVALRSITIPASCETMGLSAFENCQALESASFEPGSQLKSIGDVRSANGDSGVFSGCISLKSITIPASCRYIGSNALEIVRR